MASLRITVRVPKTLGVRLRDTSQASGRTPSDLMRAALEGYLGAGNEPGSAFELAQAAGLIGCVERAPNDLSTNRRHFESFGTNK